MLFQPALSVIAFDARSSVVPVNVIELAEFILIQKPDVLSNAVKVLSASGQLGLKDFPLP